MMRCDIMMLHHIKKLQSEGSYRKETINYGAMYFGKFCEQFLDTVSHRELTESLRKTSKRYTLVTGGTGFVGNHVLDSLMRESPHKEILLLTSKKETRHKIRGYCEKHGIKNINVIVSDLDKLLETEDDRIFQVDRVIHMAGCVAHTRQKDKVIEMNRTNTNGTYHITKLAITNQLMGMVEGKKLVYSYLSTSGTKHIYKDRERTIPVDPNQYPYFSSKLKSEDDLRQLMSICPTSIKTNIVCPTIILGEIKDMFDLDVNYSRSIVNKFMNKKFPICGSYGGINFVDVVIVAQEMVREDLLNSTVTDTVLTGYDMETYDFFKSVNRVLNVSRGNKSYIPFKISNNVLNFIYWTYLSRFVVDDVYVVMSKNYWGPLRTRSTESDICTDRMISADDIIIKSYDETSKNR